MKKKKQLGLTLMLLGFALSAMVFILIFTVYRKVKLNPGMHSLFSAGLNGLYAAALILIIIGLIIMPSKTESKASRFLRKKARLKNHRKGEENVVISHNKKRRA